MTVKQLIEMLNQYDPDIEIQMDYGGRLEEINEIYEIDDLLYIG